MSMIRYDVIHDGWACARVPTPSSQCSVGPTISFAAKDFTVYLALMNLITYDLGALFSAKKRGVMRSSKIGGTVGITLRVSKRVFRAYAAIADRANLLDLKTGGRGRKTVQDIMRHRLASLPLLRQGKETQSDQEDDE